MDDRLALRVTHPDGSVRRWGFDQPDARDIPGDLTFSTAIPGGNRTLTCGLLRDLLDADGPSLFSSVECYGPGGRTAFDGYFTQFPRDDLTIQPGAVGWSSTMKFDTGFSEIYVDRNMGGWHDAPLAWKDANATAGRTMGKIGWGLILGGMSWDIPNESLPDETDTPIQYDAGPGIAIGAAMYQGKQQGTFTGFETPTLFSGASETSFPGSATLTLDDTLRSATLSSSGRYLLMRTRVATGPVTPPAGTLQTISVMALYGSHGLTRRTISGEPDGYYGHDVIADIISRAAPNLTATQGVGGIESNTSFVIPQATFTEPTTAEEAVMKLNAYYLWEWGVYDNRAFFWRAPDESRLTWIARRDKGARLSPEGEQADAQYNGVLVYYTDPTGKSKIAGPPAANWRTGVAYADVTSSSLIDTSSVNPVNAAGLGQKWGKLQIGFPTTDSGATTLGLVWLAERSLPQRRGTITLTGSVEHPVEGEVPVWRVRAGDWIKIGDLPGDEPRRIIETTYNHGSRQLVASVGSTDFRLDAILERVGVQLVGVQL